MCSICHNCRSFSVAAVLCSIRLLINFAHLFFQAYNNEGFGSYILLCLPVLEKELPGYVHRMLYPIESFLAMARWWKHAAMAQMG
ncbi:hypothetical protein NC652_029560 [Populus alba x Populus x berolinensis]|nr:hypothetical protein NC652_029560 [Populus alba x Populus x berolinensis]